MSENSCILVLTDRSLVDNHFVEHANFTSEKNYVPKVTVKTESDKQIWKTKGNGVPANSLAIRSVPMLSTIPKDFSEFQSRGIFQGYVHTLKEIPKLKDQYEEQTASKFILYTQTKNFGDGDWMEGKHRVLWEIAPNSKDGVSLPFQGIPFFVVGHTIYDCQHGRDRNLKKKQQLRMKNNNQELNAQKKRKVQHQDSKKIDCPAQILMREVIMFPEYKIAADSHKRRQSVSQKLRYGIELHREGMDMLQTERRIYIYFPHPGEHQNHLAGGNLSGKFLEPVDPRIQEKIYNLTCQGVTGTKKMREHIQSFVNDMFQDGTPPPLDRRRYNPCDQDIRNSIKKAQAEIRKSNRNALEEQCSSVMHCIREQMATVKNDKYLKQLKDHLSNLYSLVKKEESLESLLLCYQLHEEGEEQTQSSCKKLKGKRNKQETSEANTSVQIPSQSIVRPYNNVEELQAQQGSKSRAFKQETIETLIGLPEASAAPTYSYSNSYENGQPTQVLYQEEVPHTADTQVTQIYYYHKMPTQEDVYGLANQAECNQVPYNITELKDHLS